MLEMIKSKNQFDYDYYYYYKKGAVLSKCCHVYMCKIVQNQYNASV